MGQNPLLFKVLLPQYDTTKLQADWNKKIRSHNSCSAISGANLYPIIQGWVEEKPQVSQSYDMKDSTTMNWRMELEMIVAQLF